MARLSFLQAINAAMVEEMARDDRVFLMGEDVRCNVFGSTRGMLERFGPDRVRDTPISEAGFIGAAAGASMAGMRPIVDTTMSAFLYPAMDQIVSIIAKSRYIYGGQASLPLVIRSCMFYGNGNAAQHSDRPYSMFMNVPGLKIVVPTSPADAKGLLKAAIRDPDPVLFFEDSTLWSSREEVPDDPDHLVPIGQGAVLRRGHDVTIVAIAGAVQHALRAAATLAETGISAEVIDPRCLCPLDRDLILGSVRRTGRALTVDPAHQSCSAGSEIAAIIAEYAFASLRAPVRRIATPDTHVPFNPAIEKPLYPNADRIVAVVREMLGTAPTTEN